MANIVAISTTTPWKEAKRQLANAIAFALQSQQGKNPADPDFLAAERDIDQCFELVHDVTKLGLRQIDEKAKQGIVYQQLLQLAQQAGAEAEQIRKTTKKVDDISKFIGTITSLISGITNLI